VATVDPHRRAVRRPDRSSIAILAEVVLPVAAKAPIEPADDFEAVDGQASLRVSPKFNAAPSWPLPAQRAGGVPVSSRSKTMSELERERWWISTATTLAFVPANSDADTGNVNHAVSLEPSTVDEAGDKEQHHLVWNPFRSSHATHNE